jgi:hypothetical protein
MFSKVELLAFIKNYNRTTNEKIKNADKMNKSELFEVCKKYRIVVTEETTDAERDLIEVDLRNVKKMYLLQDIEMYFLKQNKTIPTDVLQMKKSDLIAYMELNSIYHYTQELLEKEIKMYNKLKILKNIVVLNIIKYDIDVTQIPDEITDLETFVKELDADDIHNLAAYSALLKTIYDAYDTFCKTTDTIDAQPDKIKSFPKILNKLQNIL